MAAHRSAASLAVAFVVVSGIAFAGCGSAVPSSSAAASATTAAAERTAGPAAASDLAAMLPDSAAGVDFVKSSFTGEDAAKAAISLDEKALEGLAVAGGGTLADVQIAEARPRDPALGGIVIAIRVPKADPKQIVDATFSQSKALQLATIGGKSVYKVGASGLGVVVYLKDDIMFQVVGAPDALTDAVIAALP